MGIDLGGRVLKVIAQLDMSYTAALNAEVKENGTIILKGGASVHVLHDLQFLLNFTYKTIMGKGWMYHPETDPTIGQNMSNEIVLSGTGQQLLNEEGDVCISLNSLYDFRAAHVHFLPANHYTFAQVYFQQPSLTTAHNILMMPFSPTAWLCLGLLWVLILICKINLHSTSTSPSQLPAPLRQEKPFTEDISHHLLWLTGLISQQGWHGDPSRRDLRLIYLVGILSGFLTFTFYSASFLAAISGKNVYIRRFEHFQDYDYQILLKNSLIYFSLDFIKSGQDFNATYKVQYISNHIRFGELVKLVIEKNSRYAALGHSASFFATGSNLNLSHQELCKVSMMKADNPTRIMDGMVIRKNSFWRESLTYGTIKVIEVGLNKKYWDEFDRQTQAQCLRPEEMQMELNQFNFFECLSAFLVLFTGQILSLIMFVFECRRGKTGLLSQISRNWK